MPPAFDQSLITNDFARRDPLISEAVNALNQHRASFKEDREAWANLGHGAREFIESQISRCIVDPRYYLENYHVVQAGTQGIKTLFPFWDSQHLFYEKFYELHSKGVQVKLVVLKARQLGISTLAEGLIFWKTIFTPNCTTLIVAHDTNTSDFLFNMSRLAHDCLPWWMKPERRYEAKGKYLHFDRNDEYERQMNPGLRSVILVDCANKQTGVGRGKALRAVHMTELASWETGGTLAEELFPTMHAPDLLAIMESTAEGRHGFWFRFWRDTEHGKNEWTPIFIPWYKRIAYSIPLPKGRTLDLTEEERGIRKKVLEYDSYTVSDENFNWRRQQIQNFISLTGDEWKFAQEYPRCITAETRVSTNLGIIPIVDASAAKRTESGRVQRWVPQPQSPVYRLTTKAGRVLRGTADHPVMTANRKWVWLSKLKPDDRIVLRPPMFAKNGYTAQWHSIPGATVSVNIDEQWALLLGYFMGDGCWYKHEVSVACDTKDSDVIQEVKGLLERLVGSVTIKMIGKQQGQKGCTCLNSHARDIDKRSSVVPVFRALGLIHKESEAYKRKVCVPDAIWKSPRSIVKLFLSALFECDGSVTPAGIVRFYTKQLQFARDLQLLLLGFGINAPVTEVSKVSGKGARYVGYELYLGAANSELFFQQIGFRGERKSSRRIGAVSKVGRPRDPVLMEDVVDSVVFDGEEITYDFTIEGEHAFSAGGILTHNTPMEAFQARGRCAFPKRKLAKIMDVSCMDPVWIGEVYLSLENPQSKTKFVGYHDELPKQHLVNMAPGRELVEADDPGARLRVWEWPQEGESYYVSGDPALGNGGDFACSEVIRIGRGAEPDEQVAEWHGWCSPTDFADYCAALGYAYNVAEIAVEVDGVGLATYLELARQLEYPKLFRWKQYDRLKKPFTDLMGWVTNWKNRPLIISKMRDAIVQDTVIIRSLALVEEMLDFGQAEDDDKIEGQDNPDDRVMAILICNWCAHDSDYGKRVQATPRIEQAGQKYWVFDNFNRPVESYPTKDLAIAAMYYQDMQGTVRQRAGWSMRAQAAKRDFYNTDFSPVFDREGPRQRMHYEMGIPTEYIRVDNIVDSPGSRAGEDDWRNL